jgi:hypothetical protein
MAAAGIALGFAGCAPLDPAANPVATAPSVASLPTDPPIPLFPKELERANDIVIARTDPRVKYRTSPDCHYVNYDGSCKFKKFVSYKIE